MVVHPRHYLDKFGVLFERLWLKLFREVGRLFARDFGRVRVL